MLVVEQMAELAARYRGEAARDLVIGPPLELGRRPPKQTPTHSDIRLGFVYERVPHITLKSIANNTEIDVIWEKWQQTLEPLRARLNAALGRSSP